MFALPKLSLLSLVLTFRVDQDISFPAVPGHVWKGMLGNALKTGGFGLYERLFAPNVETCLAMPARGERPSAIMLDMPGAIIAKAARQWAMVEDVRVAGAEIGLGVTLFGVAAEHVDMVLNQLATVAQAGLGKADNAGVRGTAQLVRVQIRDGHGTLRDYDDDDVGLAAGTIVPVAPALVGSGVTVQFTTPLRIDAPVGHGDEKLPLAADELDATQLFVTLIRRISALAACHCGEVVALDGLKLAVAGLRFSGGDLVDCTYKKWSARQQREINTTGILGAVELDLTGHEWLWPWLYAAQFTHVGKDTVEGMGAIRVGVRG